MTDTTTARDALERAVDTLPPGLRDHVLRVVDEVRRLAPRYGVDEERAVIAALGHDLARGTPPADLLEQAEVAGLPVSDIERAHPVLLHGPLSAHLLSTRYDVEDAEVRAAARHHTTARPGMSALERLIYVADKIEPDKASRDRALAEARALAEEGLNAAFARVLEAQMANAPSRGWLLHPHTVEAYAEAARPMPDAATGTA
jgi:predicted HD superfamily hydrolase involved in NAD metabolism